MAVQTVTRDTVLPSNISVEGNKLMHTYFDNFDLLEETPSGAGTTHSTHGIMIQELISDHIPVLEESNVPTCKQKIKFSGDCLPPYFGKKRVEAANLSTTHSTRSESLTRLRNHEFAWSTCRSKFNTECKVPDWRGWLSLTTNKPVPQELVLGYMAPILNPITEYETVHHCIQLSREAAVKVHQKFCFITMDLAAAKIAYDMKWNSPDEFSDVIIQLGGFHIMCSFI